jgi:hypothetical protein
MVSREAIKIFRSWGRRQMINVCGKMIASGREKETSAKVKEPRERDLESERLEMLSTKRRGEAQSASSRQSRHTLFFAQQNDEISRMYEVEVELSRLLKLIMRVFTRILLAWACKRPAGGARAACSPGRSSSSCNCPSHSDCAVGRQSQ